MHQRTSIQVAPCNHIGAQFFRLAAHMHETREKREVKTITAVTRRNAMLYAIIIRGVEDRVRYVREVFIGEWGGS